MRKFKTLGDVREYVLSEKRRCEFELRLLRSYKENYSSIIIELESTLYTLSGFMYRLGLYDDRLEEERIEMENLRKDND